MNRSIFLYLFTFIFLSLKAQPDLKFVRYTTDNGLAHNEVLSICQDTFGFIWFGTKNGCSRFDGTKFKTYQYNENAPASMGSGWVFRIICDDKNNLWFALAGKGATFMRYDYKNDQFIDLSSTLISQLNIKSEMSDVWNIYRDSDGYIWLSVVNFGFMYYNPETNEINVLNNQPDSKKSAFSIHNFFEDADKNIWFSTSSGVFIYDKKTGLLTNYKHDPKNPSSLSSDNCTKILQDSEKNIWIGSYNGLNKLISLNSGSPVFEHFVHELQNPFSLSHNVIYDIIEYNANNLLIATVNGLCLMDKRTKKIYRYYNNELDNESINSNVIRSLYCDKDSNIWIGTNSGIGKLQIKNFKSFSHSAYKNSISHNKVESLCEAPNSDIWIATPRGIDIWDRKSGQFRFLMGITQNNSGLYGTPIAMCADSDKGMWIGTWNGGLTYFDFVTNKITNYIKNSVTQSIEQVTNVFVDSKNNLWFSVPEKGVYVYNKETGEYKNFLYDKKNKNTLSSNWVLSIMEDFESNIWVGTLNGLNLLIDFENNAFKGYLNNIEIKNIFESSDKNLWLGTNQGLYQFNKAEQQYRKFDVSDGLPDNTIRGILEDQYQALWVTANKGLARITSSQSSHPKITVYRKEEGVTVGDFITNSCAKLSDGAMLYGGTEGFCMFHPSEIKNDTLPPKIVFTNLKVVNEIVRIGQEINGQIILEESITTTKQITLNHRNNAFSIQFSGLQYNMPQYNQYCYRLEGYDPIDSKWHYVNADDRKAEYMNLPRGVYTLEVKAANSYGIWSDNPAALKIIVLPPWWRTIWFISLMIFLSVLLVVIIVRIRTYSLQKQKIKLEKIVEQRTVELKEMNVLLNERKEELEAQAEEMSQINSTLLKTNTELEIKTNEVENMAKQLHEADQSKLHFFANISHEFRTPLTLIIGPLEKCLNLKQPIYWDKVNLSDYLQLMYKNSKRLLQLINQVIDFRKIDQGRKTLKISNNNIVDFAKDVIDAFSTLAEQKQINLTLESQYPVIDFWFDSDVMGKILYNIISNAVKYTYEGGNISVQLTVNSNQSTNSNDQLPVTSNQLLIINSSFLIIKVSDTGIGIKKENISKIFDRFYRVETNETSKEEGTGIGLAYTKELVELHKGNISVESVPGKGSSFILQFPIGKEHFNIEAVSQDSDPANLNYIHSMLDDSENLNSPPSVKQADEKESKNKETDKKPVILLVEDNVDLRKFIKGELDSDYNVFESENGEEGLNMVTEVEPHLIISDIMMPIMDGISLCKRIKSAEDTSHIPVILLTAKEGEENMIKGLETGADDYITKPFNITALKIKIRNLFLLQKRMWEKFNKSVNIVPSEITDSLIDQQFMQKAIEVVNEHMHDYNFDNDAFVNLMNYGRSQVYKKVKALTDQSVGEFIRSIRLKAAAQLFLKGHNNVTEVCYKVGFKHHSVFTHYFNQMFGVPPTQFIKERLKK